MSTPGKRERDCHDSYPRQIRTATFLKFHDAMERREFRREHLHLFVSKKIAANAPGFHQFTSQGRVLPEAPRRISAGIRTLPIGSDQSLCSEQRPVHAAGRRTAISPRTLLSQSRLRRAQRLRPAAGVLRGRHACRKIGCAARLETGDGICRPTVSSTTASSGIS